MTNVRFYVIARPLKKAVAIYCFQMTVFQRPQIRVHHTPLGRIHHGLYNRVRAMSCFHKFNRTILQDLQAGIPIKKSIKSASFFDQRRKFFGKNERLFYPD